MDLITKKFLGEFSSSFELEKLDSPTKFEYFTNYCCVYKENGIVDIPLEDLSTGYATPGIDGIAIIVNNKLVTNTAEIDDRLIDSRQLDVKFVFIQAKESEKFENEYILNFFEFTKAFFMEENSTFDTQQMNTFYEIKNYIYSKAEFMIESNPKMIMYYVTTGNWNNDRALNMIIERHKKELEKLNIFSSVEFRPCGAAEIQSMYRNTKNVLTTKFKFEKNIVMFSDDDNESIGYSGVLPFSEFKKIIIGDGDTLKPVFYDNIRDFLGDRIIVNKAIAASLKNNDINIFCMLNNGITIIASKVQMTGSTVVLTDYQIVNGCQTTHILYEYRMHNIDNLLIPIKIIGTKDEETKNKITKATNSQTSVKPEQLEALSDFQKNLETYYSIFDGDKKLYYERRSGQYRLADIPKARIVTIPMQIKAVSAMFLNNPHGVSGRYGAIVKRVGEKIFNEGDNNIIYYISAFALYKLEKMLSNGIIDKKYNKARYHALMLFRIMISGRTVPKFNSKKISDYCEKMKKILYDDEDTKQIFLDIMKFIYEQKEIDFNDRKTFERKETTDLLLKRISNK